jgi:DNA-binding NarL/FixJ family response regulator
MTITAFLVEDHKLTRLGLTTYFKDSITIQIIGEAESSEDALIDIRKLHPDVVLMDMGLAEMTGIEATQHVKAFDSNIKVVMLTSHEGTQEIQDAFKAGAEAYCLKDIKMARLEEVLQFVVQGGKRPIGNIAELKTYFPHIQLQAPYYLTQREEQILRMVTLGKNNTQISIDLIISIHTVKAHVYNVMQKLFVKNRIQAVMKALKEKLI